MSYAILAESVGKSFTLHHLRNRPNDSLRDALAGSLSHLSRSLLRRTRGNQQDETEEFWALKDIFFQIRPGERIGLLGRNGAGKSTLLKILSRTLEPSTGRIRIRGRIASLLEVGTGFHPELTGRENIYFNGAMLGMSKAEIGRKFDEIVDFAEVEQFLDTPVKHYSSGMYVRLGFAVAAHIDPEILIVDEVLAVGDARFQKKSIGKMHQIGQEGRTLLFVSHNMNSIMQLTQRALVLEHGKIVCDSATGDAVTRYLSVDATEDGVRPLKPRVDWLSDVHFRWLREETDPGFNNPLNFRLGFATERRISRLVFTIGFVNTVGARVLTCKANLDDIESGQHSLGLGITDHHLIPGTYFVQLDLWDSAEELFSYENICTVDLFAASTDDRLIQHISRRRGDKLGCYAPITLQTLPASESHQHD
ncbi:ABC transporter ATP-binding protein [Methylococcus geothermalis]|uniref:ATP-binding cassette domain-containing protein n=1 Tax=Methylococcus geothermalis TaxID=2681310 RepID=A0A858QBQ0_9GAMM|nr:ABC transporter ATP-binding protein [Methylococcus geothermalis]QJD31126.1 ATP-binding cassette domain-containing protein [Methylococcus geothermalis]